MSLKDMVDALGPFWFGQWVLYGNRVWRVSHGSWAQVTLCALRDPSACGFVTHDHLWLPAWCLLRWGNAYDPSTGRAVPFRSHREGGRPGR